ncbi:MAG: superoxide dismutase [Candidatus Bacteroides intestinipullorum]|uniref:Superoxide dismutase n=1 Tax=Candidatus Bacteroides intestinipullorum TaxID=2838471 RepID=A0A9E2KFD0_9BACE|nr:superoxide dismutase [Candidatus Bacteroides intestinipullorum]
MKNEMPKLPYPNNGLEPVISAETLTYHYGKHLQTYVTNLANLTAGTAYEQKEVEDIVATAPDGAIFNNAGQVLNHTLYFLQFTTPHQVQAPEGRLAELIYRDFGSLDNLKEQMEKAAIGLFGSGWAWLSLSKEGTLQITQESNAGNPLRRGDTPLLCIDVWEHAYYIDYRNRRADHVKRLWDIINWQAVSNRL